MDYEIVTLEEKTVAGICARTGNADPQMSAVIADLWSRFYQGGVYTSIPGKVNQKALGIYTDYAGDETGDYTAMAACEVRGEPLDHPHLTVCMIPAGRYARLIVKGEIQTAVAQAWQEIWRMDLPRDFQCDFEEYQNDDGEHAQIHLYIGLRAQECEI